MAKTMPGSSLNVRTPPMPDRALRRIVSPRVVRGDFIVRTPPMPDRALRRKSCLSERSRPGTVRTPPMPDRALRPYLFYHHYRRIVRPNASNARQGIKTASSDTVKRPQTSGPNASNARQGIKTLVDTAGLPTFPESPNASNARQGIKTQYFIGQLLSRNPRGPNASNARQGIKTHIVGPDDGRPVHLPVRTPPMPDRALRLITTGRESRSEIFVRTPPMPDRALRRPL